MVVQEQTNSMRTYLIIAILFLSLSSLAQDHPFYSINDPKIKENLNKVDPKDYQNAFFNGLRYKILGDPDKALEYFSECIRMNGKEPTPMYESAILYFNKGQLDQAQFFIESACQLEPENKWFQQLLATTYLENGQYSKAITSFKKLLKIDPKNEDWHFELASAYLLNNQARNAIKVYDDLEKYIGPYDMLFQQKKRIYSEIGDKAGAIREVEKWVVAEPKNLEALNELSELYLLSGKQAKAIQTLEKSLELKSDNAMAFIMLSDLYRNNKELDKSFDYTKKAFGSLDLGIDAKMRLLLTYYDWTDTDTLLLSKAYTLIDILSETHPNDAKPFTIAGDYFYYDSTLVETGSLPEYYDGSLFILEWTRNWVKEIRFNEEGELFQINPFFQSEPLIRPIDMQIGPDGAMYIIEWGTGFFEDNPDDRIIKIEFAQNLANRTPTARATSNIQSGMAPLTVEFRGEDSSDPDGDALQYSWDFDGDQTEDAATANASFTYTENGDYLATYFVVEPFYTLID